MTIKKTEKEQHLETRGKEEKKNSNVFKVTEMQAKGKAGAFSSQKPGKE